MFASLEEAASMRGPVERFEPAMEAAVREARLAGWKQAVDGVLQAAQTQF
jgi:glycerol kinase